MMKRVEKSSRKIFRRTIALALALVMAFPVMNLHNKGVGTAYAVSEMVPEKTYLSGMQISYGDTYTVHVPCDNIRFTLPALPSTEPSTETVEIYTNEAKSAWSLTETDELKTKYSAIKTTTVSYEWAGDVNSDEESNYITSAQSGTKTAVIKKSETVEYKRSEDNTLIDGLSSNPSYETGTFKIQTDVPATVNFNHDTFRVIDNDALRTDGATEFYYGEPRYKLEIKEGDDLKTIKEDFDYDGLDSYISGGPDGFYYITKYMIGEYSSQDKIIYEAPGSTKVTKNAVIILTNSIKEVNGTAEQSKEYDSTLSLEGVNPNNDVMISFEADDDGCSVVSTPMLECERDGKNYELTVPADISKNNTTVLYEIQVKDHHGLTKPLNVTIKYGNGTPAITGDTLTGASEVEGVNYVNSELESLIVSANASSPNASIVSGKVGICTSSDMTGEILGDASYNSEGIIEKTYTLSDLTEGNNYFRVRAKSDYGIESKSNMILNVVLDSKVPTISNVVLKQDGNTIADGTKITCMNDAEITFDIADANPSSGIASVEVKRAKSGGDAQPVSETPEISGGKATLKIPADKNNSGNTYTYKFIAYDKAGNKSSEVEKKVTFEDDMSLTITRIITPSVVDDFTVWTDNTKVAVIEYEVTSDVDIPDNATISLDGVDISSSSAFEIIDIKHYKYTLDYNQSETVKNIVLTVTNKNGYTVTDTLAVLHIDVADPQDNGITGDSKWQKSFVLTGTVSDPQDGDPDAVSGLNSAEYTITNSNEDASQDIDVSSGTGTVNITVPESKTGEGTKITFDLSDKANNNYTNTYTFFIDATDPTADLSVAGMALSGKETYYLQEDPVIEYSGSDSLSGLAETDGIVFRINGTEYNNVSGRKLSEIVGTLNNSKEYSVELTVTDKAGNSVVKEAVFTVEGVTVSSDGTWTEGSESDLEFIISRIINNGGTFSHFTGIQVDKKNVGSSDYTAGSGSVIIKLKAEYLKTLSSGSHTLTVQFDDGDDVSAQFVIKALHTIIWLDGDGKELDRKVYVEGTAEPKTEKTPSKTDADNNYTFVKWDDGTVSGKTKTYQPVFSSLPKKLYVPTQESIDWQSGSDKSAELQIKRAVEDAICYDQFAGEVYVDGKAIIRGTDYTDRKGSTIISFKPEYLKTLAVGSHTIKVVFKDGESSAVLKVLAPAADTTPTTGDSGMPLLWATMLLVSLAGAAVMIERKRRKA